MPGLRFDRREIAAVLLGSVGVVLVGVAYASVRHQWADYCANRFGHTHGMLVAAGVLGLASIGVGFRSDRDLDRVKYWRVGLTVGFVAALGALLVYWQLAGRGCGD